VTFDPGTGLCQLVIGDVMAADQGLFRCVARNSAGSAETKAALSVLPPPAGPAHDDVTPAEMTSSQVSTVPTSGDEVQASQKSFF